MNRFYYQTVIDGIEPQYDIGSRYLAICLIIAESLIFRSFYNSDLKKKFCVFNHHHFFSQNKCQEKSIWEVETVY